MAKYFPLPQTEIQSSDDFETQNCDVLIASSKHLEEILHFDVQNFRNC